MNPASPSEEGFVESALRLDLPPRNLLATMAEIRQHWPASFADVAFCDGRYLPYSRSTKRATGRPPMNPRAEDVQFSITSRLGFAYDGEHRDRKRSFVLDLESTK